MEKLVRRPNAVILFISLSLLMMLTTGCQEIKLKAGIEAANKQCPIDMGETGKITSIVYDGENVVYTFYLNEEAANIKTLQKNPESMKTSLKIMFQNPNKEVKSLLDLVVKCKAGLQMIYIGKDSGEQVVCELTKLRKFSIRMSTPPKATWLNWKRRYRWQTYSSRYRQVRTF